MPLKSNNCDCSPLLIDREIHVSDELKLAQYIGYVILGYYSHVQSIIDSENPKNPTPPNHMIDQAISKLQKTPELDIVKRDGWIFQIISWLALHKEYSGQKYYSQQPHEAPAQHGIDGLAVLVNSYDRIERVYITEDKCTENPRQLIKQSVWPEFEDYENGEYDSKLVSKVSALLANINNDELKQSVYNDAFRKEIRRYRVGINRDSRYNETDGKTRLFKGYDECVPDESCERRSGATLCKEDIRGWMEHISQLTIKFLETKKV